MTDVKCNVCQAVFDEDGDLAHMTECTNVTALLEPIYKAGIYEVVEETEVVEVCRMCNIRPIEDNEDDLCNPCWQRRQ